MYQCLHSYIWTIRLTNLINPLESVSLPLYVNVYASLLLMHPRQLLNCCLSPLKFFRILFTSFCPEIREPLPPPPPLLTGLKVTTSNRKTRLHTSPKSNFTQCPKHLERLNGFNRPLGPESTRQKQHSR